jgi:hypothetical protein
LLVFHLLVEVVGLEVQAVEEHPAMVWLAGQGVEHLIHQKLAALEL